MFNVIRANLKASQHDKIDKSNITHRVIVNVDRFMTYKMLAALNRNVVHPKRMAIFVDDKVDIDVLQDQVSDSLIFIVSKLANYRCLNDLDDIGMVVYHVNDDDHFEEMLSWSSIWIPHRSSVLIYNHHHRVPQESIPSVYTHFMTHLVLPITCIRPMFDHALFSNNNMNDELKHALKKIKVFDFDYIELTYPFVEPIVGSRVTFSYADPIESWYGLPVPIVHSNDSAPKSVSQPSSSSSSSLNDQKPIMHHVNGVVDHRVVVSTLDDDCHLKRLLPIFSNINDGQKMVMLISDDRKTTRALSRCIGNLKQFSSTEFNQTPLDKFSDKNVSCIICHTQDDDSIERLIDFQNKFKLVSTILLIRHGRLIPHCYRSIMTQLWLPRSTSISSEEIRVFGDFVTNHQLAMWMQHFDWQWDYVGIAYPFRGHQPRPTVDANPFSKKFNDITFYYFPSDGPESEMMTRESTALGSQDDQSPNDDILFDAHENVHDRISLAQSHQVPLHAWLEKMNASPIRPFKNDGSSKIMLEKLILKHPGMLVSDSWHGEQVKSWYGSDMMVWHGTLILTSALEKNMIILSALSTDLNDAVHMMIKKLITHMVVNMP